MKKNNLGTRLIGFLLLFTLSLSLLSACGKEKEKVNDPENPVEEQQEQTPETPATVAVTGITVSMDSFTLNTTDAGIQLTASVSPSDATNPAYTWSSSNIVIATVDATGLVMARNNGTCDIVATTSDGGFTAVCTITVQLPEPEPVLATALALNLAEETLYVGDTLALEAFFTPEDVTDKILTWTSSDEAVATVDDFGCVTAVKKGTASITAAASNGVAASCAITVKKASSSSSSEGKTEGGSSSGKTDSGKTEKTNSKLSFGSNPTYPKATLDSDGYLVADLLQDYHDYNSDVVAWLYVPGTNINFPVAQRPNGGGTSLDDYYLTRGLDKKTKATGSCYLDERDTTVASQGLILNHNNIFYGHAKGTDIFDQLEEVTRTDEWFNNESNRYVYVNTLKGRYVFEVFATYYMNTKQHSVIQNINFSLDKDGKVAVITDLYKNIEANADAISLMTSNNEMFSLQYYKDTDAFLKFCNSWKDRVDTTYSEKGVNFGYLKDRDFGVTVDKNDTVITLYTCADAGEIEKYILQAALVRFETYD